MKTILYVDHTAKLGGGELALRDLIEAIDKKRYKPIVLLSSDGPLTAKLRTVGVETHILPLDQSIVNMRKDSLDLRSAPRVRVLVGVLRYAKQLGKWARQHQVDLIHANSLKADICGGLAGRMVGIPVIWHVRDTIAAPYLAAPVASMFRFLARHLPTAVIANSRSTMSTLALPSGKINAIVYSGIQPERRTDEQEVGTNSNGARIPIVTLVGRVAKWKGQHILIKAAAKVLKQYPSTEFWIAGSPLFGEDDYERKIKALAEELGIGASVKFLGFRDDIPEILRCSSIVVHASTMAEPFGQVIVQGMAAGKPVVATNGGAVPEVVVADTTGLVVPMGDADAMASAIEWLLGNPAKAVEMGREGKKRAYEYFCISQSATAVESLYCKMLNESPD